MTTPATFTPRTATRARGTYLAARTPEEFLADPRNILKLSEDLAGRYARRCPFMDIDDLRNDIAVIVLRASRTWTPNAENPSPFGGFAWKSAELWLRGEMLRASVPVSGAETRADTEAVRYFSVDARVSTSDDESTTRGALIGWESVVGASSHRPDEKDDVSDLHAAAAKVLGTYDEDTRDALLSALLGTPVPRTELPRGFTPEGFGREVVRLRVRLAGALHTFAGPQQPETCGNLEPQAPPDMADDPWVVRLR